MGDQPPVFYLDFSKGHHHAVELADGKTTYYIDGVKQERRLWLPQSPQPDPNQRQPGEG